VGRIAAHSRCCKAVQVDFEMSGNSGNQTRQFGDGCSARFVNFFSVRSVCLKFLYNAGKSGSLTTNSLLVTKEQDTSFSEISKSVEATIWLQLARALRKK